jgi:high affinity sulfate transporter 1
LPTDQVKTDHMQRLARFAPGLPTLLRYRLAEDFPHDLVAGVSVAAVALPVSVAYAQLAGFTPVVGLYSSILPLAAYAIFGTSRQLIVNPDAATCAMISAAIAPLAAANSEQYLSLSVTITFFTGLFCIAASFFRLGALADFLSKPLLVGFLNGIAISIFLSQIGKVFGFSMDSHGIVPRLIEFVSKLPRTHVPTLAVGIATFAVLFLSRHFLPRFPAALLGLVAAAAITAAFALDGSGVAILGSIPAGLPHVRLPSVPPEHLPVLLGDAAGLALVLFTSGTLTARSFAAKGRYELNIDKELAAYGAANVASALSQGFAVTGADSRTAMADAAGGRTQVTGLVAAAIIAIVLLFLTGPLRYVPTPALGAVLIFAALSLFNVKSLREFWQIDRIEFALAIVAMLGVVAVGAINGILVAVVLALARFIKQTARPRDEVLGTVDGLQGFHSIERHAGAKTHSGITLFRFNAPLTFFNADYFKQRALAAASAAGSELKWFVIDTIPIADVDINGLYALRDLREALESHGITLVLAGRRTEFLDWFQKIGIYKAEHDNLIFPTLRQALRVYRHQFASNLPTED